MATIYGSGYAPAARGNKWQDWVNLVLAVWLFVSPWVLQFGAGSNGIGGSAVHAAAWNDWVLGVLVFLSALSAIGRMEFWQEWLNMIFGIWLFVAPWALGFTGLRAAAWDSWIVGAVIFLIAACSYATARNRTEGRNP